MGRSTIPYDFLWPVMKPSAYDQGKVVEVIGVGKGGKRTKGKASRKSDLIFLHRFIFLNLMGLSAAPIPSVPVGTYEDLQGYARRLLSSFPEPSSASERSNRIKIKQRSISPLPQQLPSQNGNGNVHDGDASRRPGSAKEEEGRRIERELEWEDEGGLTGCREAVEILTRNPKKGKCGGG